ncbi:hypothetical protein HDU90_004320 [Geranomyces variabilis]|nr:hypothetical protein HDU90_004320 [Geranomyces variabilis]
MAANKFALLADDCVLDFWNREEAAASLRDLPLSIFPSTRAIAANKFALLADDCVLDFWNREEAAAILGREKEGKPWEKGAPVLFPEEHPSELESVRTF